jgi:hypothetical protein
MMDEYTKNIHARIDNILNDIQQSHPSTTTTTTKYNATPFDFSIQIGVCWLIVGVLIGCVICYYSLYDNDFDHDRKKKNYE